MTIAVGKEEYQCGIRPTTGCGFSYSDDELNAALEGGVKDTVFDVVGHQKIVDSLSVDTGFSKDKIAQKLEINFRRPETWRVGEGIAECYLSTHRNCVFPWSDNKDERRVGSSLPGPDLVGFKVEESDVVYFAFGEVKTSCEHKSPPQVVKGRLGLQAQIEDIRDNEETKVTLVRYLAHRFKGQDWEHLFKKAFQNFLQCSKNIRIFGFLVRDTQPNTKDIETCVTNLAKVQYPGTIIELLVLYLPNQSIEQLGHRVMQYQDGGIA